MGKSCRDMAEALRDCMVLEECMSDGTRTLKQCLKLKEYSHECRVRGCLRRRRCQSLIDRLTD